MISLLFWILYVASPEREADLDWEADLDRLSVALSIRPRPFCVPGRLFITEFFWSFELWIL